MERRKLLRLTNLVENMGDFEYIQDIDGDEYNFIFDKKHNSVLPIDKFQFLIELKRLDNNSNVKYKSDNYYAAFIEAKKVALFQDRELFMSFVNRATKPEFFTKPYVYYLDCLTIDFQKSYRDEIKAAKKKVKYLYKELKTSNTK